MRQTIAAVIVAIVAVVFALQNSQETVLTLFLWKVNLSLALLILSALLSGIAIGMLLLTKRIRKDKSTISELKKKIVFLETPKNTPASKQGF